MQSKSFAWLFAVVGICIAIAGNLAICWSEWQLYKGVSVLPPGTGIRPMGNAFIECVVCLLTLILAIPFCLVGGLLGIQKRKWFSLFLAIIGVVLAFAPFPMARWLTGKIIAATGVVMEP